jgi:hypothetical protein
VGAEPGDAQLAPAGAQALKTVANQAMNTAINASKNIKIAPATGKTMGIKGTIFSTASGSWASGWGVGADMVIPWM